MTSLKGHLLLAAPSLLAPMFARSVILVLGHDESGAMGVILNVPTGTTMTDLAGKLFEEDKADFDSRGMGPFRPNGPQTFKPYHYEVLDNPEALLSWAYRAIRAGQESQVLVP